MSKRINITARPKQNPAADQWVETRLPPAEQPPVRLKRLTIDLDPELHKRLKLHCFQQDVPIAELLRELIERAVRN
ncbi:hypothetical protein SH668x_000069 [Planctomicrobium sp. SH668]|uniref:hypothetical protein n=1 Tax=Planctomicrobium sp. SH668 TaxID=3448126 RepID=UPI003F5B413E